MAIVKVQETSSTTILASIPFPTIEITWAQPTVPGNLIIAVVGGQPSGWGLTPSPGHGSTPYTWGTAAVAFGTCGIEIWKDLNQEVHSGTEVWEFSVGLPSPTFQCSITLMEFSGFANGLIQDFSGQNLTGTGTFIDLQTGTNTSRTQHANTFILTGVANPTNTAFSAPTGGYLISTQIGNDEPLVPSGHQYLQTACLTKTSTNADNSYAGTVTQANSDWASASCAFLLNDLYFNEIQSAHGTQSSASSLLSAHWASPTRANNLLVAVVGFKNSNVLTSVTPPSGWTLAVSSTNTDIANVQIYYISNASTRSGTETFTLTNSANSTLILAEYSGVDYFDVLCQSATLFGNSSTADSGTTANTGTDVYFNPVREAGPNGTAVIQNVIKLAIAGFFADSASMSSPTNNFTLVNHVTANSVQGGMYTDAELNQRFWETSVTIPTSKWAGAIVTFVGVGSTSVFYPIGITSGEAFGTPQITGTNQTILLTGIPSVEHVGSPVVIYTQFVNLTGVASAETFGAATTKFGVALTGIASAEAVGSPNVQQRIDLTGIVSDETIPVPVLSWTLFVDMFGIFDEDFGTQTIQMTISPSGVPSDETFGTPQCNLRIDLQGIFEEAFGATIVNFIAYETGSGGVIVHPISIHERIRVLPGDMVQGVLGMMNGHAVQLPTDNKLISRADTTQPVLARGRYESPHDSGWCDFNEKCKTAYLPPIVKQRQSPYLPPKQITTPPPAIPS